MHPDLRKAAGGGAAATVPDAATPPPGGPAAVQRTVPGPKGAPDVKITVINGGRGAATPRPAILHIHGGGYTGGSAAIMVPTLQALAAALDCVIVSVDYRLAPGDKVSGISRGQLRGPQMALLGTPRELGVDASRIAVMGESAGGGHAAMLAIAARDRGEVPLLYQASSIRCSTIAAAPRDKCRRISARWCGRGTRTALAGPRCLACPPGSAGA